MCRARPPYLCRAAPPTTVAAGTGTARTPPNTPGANPPRTPSYPRRHARAGLGWGRGLYCGPNALRASQGAPVPGTPPGCGTTAWGAWPWLQRLGKQKQGNPGKSLGGTEKPPDWGGPSEEGRGGSAFQGFPGIPGDPRLPHQLGVCVLPDSVVSKRQDRHGHAEFQEAEEHEGGIQPVAQDLQGGEAGISRDAPPEQDLDP